MNTRDASPAGTGVQRHLRAVRRLPHGLDLALAEAVAWTACLPGTQAEAGRDALRFRRAGPLGRRTFCEVQVKARGGYAWIHVAEAAPEPPLLRFERRADLCGFKRFRFDDPGQIEAVMRVVRASWELAGDPEATEAPPPIAGTNADAARCA